MAYISTFSKHAIILKKTRSTSTASRYIITEPL